jgi:hypothetical protein
MMAPNASGVRNCIWPWTLGHLLALHVTPANADDRAEVGRLADAIQEATGESVTLAYVD